MTDDLIWAIAVFDIDGVLRDVSGSYRRALADTVEELTQGGYRPTSDDIDTLKAEGKWNNDWEGSQELALRYFDQQGQVRSQVSIDFDALVAFFQSRYRGPDPTNWTGYICQEPLLVDRDYFEQLTQAGIAWGFFSGATRGSAQYVLERRVGIGQPVLVAMEDAPGKPDPSGLFEVVHQLEQQHSLPENLPVVYAGDTVADMQTIVQARQQSDRPMAAIGILPPHARKTAEYELQYRDRLSEQGADIVLAQVRDLTPEQLRSLIG
jgi:HAD superfamily phosphatase